MKENKSGKDSQSSDVQKMASEIERLRRERRRRERFEATVRLAIRQHRRMWR